MSNTYYALIYFCGLIIIGQGLAGTAEITGGWSITGDGGVTSSGTSQSGCIGGDPSITLGITAASSVYGPGKDSRTWQGKQSIDIGIAGFRLAAAYDGQVSSNVILASQGSASSAAFIGASATGISTGAVPIGGKGDSYDLFGWADISTEGFVAGQGSAAASASGQASYDVQKLGTASEVWGQASGESSMDLVSGSASGVVSSGGEKNGLYAESRSTRSMSEDISTSAIDRLTAYGSVVNKGSANVRASGEATSGSWDHTFTGTKVKSNEVTGNENVASSVHGTLGTLDHRVVTGADGDAADVSATISATAYKDLTSAGDLSLSVSGGPATYASASQTSSSEETYSQIWARDALWGSLARNKDNQQTIEWGKVNEVGAGAICSEPSDALSFAKIQMVTDYSLISGKARAKGNMTIATFAQGTQNLNALGGAIIDGAGQGSISASDSAMTNDAGYEGGMDHFSFVDPAREFNGAKGYAETRNIAWIVFAGADPKGAFAILKPFETNTVLNPTYAWSSSEGFYDQSR
jgi:hypothetical protein